MEGKFYPATPLDKFDDIHSALKSGDVHGHYADLIVAEADGQHIGGAECVSMRNQR
jgi:hypothetical protein